MAHNCIGSLYKIFDRERLLAATPHKRTKKIAHSSFVPHEAEKTSHRRVKKYRSRALSSHTNTAESYSDLSVLYKTSDKLYNDSYDSSSARSSWLKLASRL